MSTALTFVSGVGEVTGSNFLIEDTSSAGASTKILVDCGLVQGIKFAQDENHAAFSYDPKTIDFLIVTHAHLDHIGRIPKLVRDGFRGVIYSTEVTHEIAAPMFDDALSLLDAEARREGMLPLYERKDVTDALALWRGVKYHEEMVLKGGYSFYLKDAGHILGSAMVEIRRGGKKIVFTGDLGNSPSPLLHDTEVVDDADYLVMESVYGDRNHEPKEERDQQFTQILKSTIEQGGTIVIPAFSLERTQNILYSLNNLVEDGHIPSVPVFLDSPLAIEVTKIYKKHVNDFKKEIRDEISGGDDIFSFPKLSFTDTTQESNAIQRVHGSKIILAGSGMSAGGRVTKHERHFLPDPKSTILLVGYQSVGTLGRMIEEGKKKVTINGDTIEVKARIENIRGFSSHKDSNALVAFASQVKHKVKQIYVVMGEPKASLFLTQRLRDYEDLPALYPERGRVYSIDL
mgnify:CR=1 FL=1